MILVSAARSTQPEQSMPGRQLCGGHRGPVRGGRGHVHSPSPSTLVRLSLLLRALVRPLRAMLGDSGHITWPGPLPNHSPTRTMPTS